MKQIVKHIDLNVRQPNNHNMIHIMQGTNNTVTINASIYDGNTLYDTSNLNASLILLDGVTPAGKKIDTACTLEEDGTISFTLTNNMLCTKGVLHFSIVMIDAEGNALPTFPFSIRVHSDLLETAQESEVTAITDLALDAQKAALMAGKKAEEADNYAQQAKSVLESFSGTLRPKGTIAFTNLPPLTSAETGDMYNISDQFTTNSDFAEGSGNVIPAGSNVYKTADGQWDILAGSPVTGVKGNTESTYRSGNVNITPEDIGAVNKSGDTMSGSLSTTYLQSQGTKMPLVNGRDESINTPNTSKLYGDSLVITNPATFGDNGWIRMLGTDENDSVLEIATGDDGNQSGGTVEQIVVRQYGSDNDVHREIKLFDKNGNATFPGKVTATGFAGNATSATKLATSRTIRTNLASTSAASFNGSANVTPGVTGILPVANGGTGNSTGTAQNSDTVDGRHASSFLGNNTGYVYPYVSGRDLNTILDEWHGFVFNGINHPGDDSWGFLDVSYYDGTGFSPSPPPIGVCRQIFTRWATGESWIRCYSAYFGGWAGWVKISNDGFATNADNFNVDGKVICDYYAVSYSNRQNIRFAINAESEIMLSFRSYYTGRGVKFYDDGSSHYYFGPYNDNGMYLGYQNTRWNQIYSTNSAISTSDRTEKKEISYIGNDSEYDTAMSDGQLEQLIMGIKPVVFKRTNGESNRPHHGLIAQDFETLMEEIGLSDHAAFIKSPKLQETEREVEIEQEDGTKETVTQKELVEIEGEYTYGFRYEELITDIIRFAQLQKKRADQLEERIAKLEEQQIHPAGGTSPSEE